VPTSLALTAGGAVQAVWPAVQRLRTSLPRRHGAKAPAGDADPPLTRFVVEQLATAHWFDQRRTRAALGWYPTVRLDEGFARLRAWYLGHDATPVTP
jgi:nucleoside-diphosphate-sugar epimerase